jgi:hypothetical protein
MRDIVADKALQQCTDQEIDAALALLDEPPMSPGEIALAQQLRLVGRAELRSAIFEEVKDLEKLRGVFEENVQRLAERGRAQLLTNREEIALFRALSSVLVANPATRAQVKNTLAHQFLGFTSKGYDAELRSDAEDAELIAAAEREEARRNEIDNAH